jgi:hypothetical protein
LLVVRARNRDKRSNPSTSPKQSYRIRAKLKNDQIKEITSKAIEQLTTLNEGRSETLTAYLTAMAKFHRYSLRNVMLIAMQRAVTCC